MPAPGASAATRIAYLVSAFPMMACPFAPDTFPSLLPRLRTSTLPAAAPPPAPFPPGYCQPFAARCVLRSPHAGDPHLAAWSPTRPAAAGIAAPFSFQIFCFDGKEPSDDSRGLLPTVRLCLQLFAPGPRQVVIPRLPVVLGNAPLRRDRSLLLQSQQHRI